jgi:DNA-binding HxlR family transcriptional regulator
MNRCNETQLTNVVTLLRGRWTIRILFLLQGTPRRLSELQRMIPGASKKGLTASLRALEEHHVIERRDLSKTILHVEYSISEAHRNYVAALIQTLSQWSCSLSESPCNSEQVAFAGSELRKGDAIPTAHTYSPGDAVALMDDGGR